MYSQRYKSIIQFYPNLSVISSYMIEISNKMLQKYGLKILKYSSTFVADCTSRLGCWDGQ